MEQTGVQRLARVLRWLVLAVLAIPIAVAVLRRQGKAIAERIRREYE